jgi:D-alanine--poly(phosphoribitol) ligase subunit 2
MNQQFTDTAAIEQRLLGIFTEKLNLTVPSPELDLMSAGILDSLVFVDLLLQIEREFQITVAITELDIEQFRSVRSMVKVVISQTR